MRYVIILTILIGFCSGCVSDHTTQDHQDFEIGDPAMKPYGCQVGVDC